MAATKTEALKRAQQKYMKNVARIGLVLKHEEKEAISAHAAKMGESVGSFLVRSALEQIKRDSEAEV